MRKQTIVCDRCQKDTSVQWHTIEEVDRRDVSFDLCTDCYTAFLAWMATSRAKLENIRQSKASTHPSSFTEYLNIQPRQSHWCRPTAQDEAEAAKMWKAWAEERETQID